MQQRYWIAGGVLLTATVGYACGRPAAAPVTSSSLAPPGACSVALTSGTEQTDRDRQIAAAQEEARGGGAPALRALERLGYLYVARARVSNDPGDYTLADETARCLESRNPGDHAALLLRGHVLHQLHRFREAEGIARQLINARTVALDHGLLGDALMEQGRLAEAAAAYQTMLDLKPFYQSYTRAAHVRWLKGDLPGAIEAMQLAIDASSPRDREAAAWAWTRMAVYKLQARSLVGAAAAAQTALELQPEYPAALLVQGRILLAEGRPDAALSPLRRAAALVQTPEYLWPLVDVLRLQHLDAEAETAERQLVERGTLEDPRTLAVYLATRRADPAKAIALAEAELTIRADVFTLDAHAWALAAGDRTAEALAVMERALAEGTSDARLFLHAGVINLAAGKRSQARAWFRKAETLKAMLLPSEAAALARHLTSAL
jgi:tetratricopeptide (TPR) repeat protein